MQHHPHTQVRRLAEVAEGRWSGLGGLPRPVRERMDRLAAAESHAPGTVLLDPADTERVIFTVLSGEVALSRRMPNGFLSLPTLRGPGSVFGECSLRTGRSGRSEVVANTPVELRVLRGEAIERALREIPGMDLALTALATMREHKHNVVTALRGLPLFATASFAALAPLAPLAELRRYHAGDDILVAGEEVTGLHYVAEGQVDLFTPTGRRIGWRGPGQFVGAAGATGQEHEPLGAKATRPTEVLFIPASAVHERLRVSAGFRRACGGAPIVVEPGSPAVDASEFTQTVALVSERPINTRRALAGLAAALHADFDDDVFLLHLREGPKAELPDWKSGIPAGELRQAEGRIPRTAAGRESLLRWLERSDGFEYVLLSFEDDTRRWLPVLGDAVGRVLYLTSDTLRPAPVELADARITWCADLDGDRKAPKGDRPGTVRVGLDWTAEINVQSPLAGLTGARRESLSRWGRAVSERRVGIGLGGGGAFGFAHVPLLKALGRQGVPIDMLAGASIGSLCGAFYCCDPVNGPDRLFELAGQAQAAARKGMFTSSHLATFVNRALNNAEMGNLEIPFFAVSTDVSRGRQVVTSHGSIGEGVRASSAFPLAMTPVIRDGRRLVDGGIIQNVPIDPLVDHRAELVIVSNIVPAPQRERPESRLPMIRRFAEEFGPVARLRDAMRSALLMMHTAGATGAWSADMHFNGEPTDINPGNFHAGIEVAKANEAAAEAFAADVAARWKALRHHARVTRG